MSKSSSSRHPSAPNAGTLEDVARAAGVSPRTVSNALRGVGKGLRVDAVQRAEKIRRIASEMGYRPNGAARAFSRGRFNAVALLQSTDAHRSYTHPSLLSAIQQVLDPLDMHLAVCRLPDSSLTASGFVPKILREYMADGLLINYTYKIPPRMIDLIESFGLPAVWMNTRREYDAVYFDEVAGGRMAIDQVADRGHRLVAYLDLAHRKADLASEHYSAQDRVEGIVQRAGERGVALRTYFRDEAFTNENEQGSGTATLAFLDRLLATPDRPTAVICQNTSLATALAFVATRRRLSLGDQLSLVTFGHSPEHTLGEPMPYVHMSFREVGRIATQWLDNRIERPEAWQPSQVVGPSFVAGPLLGPGPA